ncbi:hypothetical protein HXX01_00690 [Candidatus Nomurabacteria bacterium]|nr:hypothetical protein [Candidatus Nomurabacteria bacterium]
MKKVFILLILSLIATSIYASSYNKILLTKDKSEILNILVTEYTKGPDTMITEEVILGGYRVPENLRYYMNDSVANQIIKSYQGIYLLPDSLYPRITHMFGKDTFEVRQLQTSFDGNIEYKKLAESSVDSNPLIFWVSLVISIILILFGLVPFNRIYVVVVSILLAVFFFFGFIESIFTFLDIILCMGVLILPAIIIICNIIIF